MFLLAMCIQRKIHDLLMNAIITDAMTYLKQYHYKNACTVRSYADYARTRKSLKGHDRMSLWMGCRLFKLVFLTNKSFEIVLKEI